jgi:hypothetical protein
VGVVALCGNHASGEGSRRGGAVREEFGGRRPHMSRVNGSLVGWSGPDKNKKDFQKLINYFSFNAKREKLK